MKRTAPRQSDRRVQRSRKRLFDALMKLITEKGYSNTKVQDVLERAGVGRATFYTHFYNKEDLLLGQLPLFKLYPCTGVDASSSHGYIPDFTSVFAHCRENYRLYIALRETEAMDAVRAIAREDLVNSFRAWLRDREALNGGGDDPEFIAQFLAGALIQLLFWWMDEEMPEPAIVMGRRFATIAMRML